MTCKECLYYEPGDGSKGYCCVEPKRIFVDGKRVRCRYFLPKEESEVEHDG